MFLQLTTTLNKLNLKEHENKVACKLWKYVVDAVLKIIKPAYYLQICYKLQYFTWFLFMFLQNAVTY